MFLRTVKFFALNIVENQFIVLISVDIYRSNLIGYELNELCMCHGLSSIFNEKQNKFLEDKIIRITSS